MKFNWLFLIFMVCGVSQAKAQFSLGATGGINLSNVENKDVPDNFLAPSELVVYQYIGLMPNYQFGKKFSVSANFHFSQKGYQEGIVQFQFK
ncbi:MAG: hypothetical protein ACI9XO_001767 [Paraglaciecola sp.]|jgi:hypothetical protein